MYAIVEIGGKQYKAEKGAGLVVDLIDSKAGDKLDFKTVTLFRNDKEIVIGNPYVEKAVVKSEVVEPLIKGDKQVVFKYKQKASYRRKTGHRQKYTSINITDIVLKGTEKEKA